MEVRPADLANHRVLALLEHHATTAREQTAKGSAHALDLTAFRSSDLSLWTVWAGDELLGIGALKQLSPTLAEVKAMHTTKAARRRGVGGMMLNHLISLARERGLDRVSLETGSWPYFEPARTFYRSHGFVDCLPFGDYAPDPNSVFMTLISTERSRPPSAESRTGRRWRPTWSR